MFNKRTLIISLFFFSARCTGMSWDVWAHSKFWQEHNRKEKADTIAHNDLKLINRVILLRATHPDFNLKQMKDLLVQEIPLTLDQAISLYNSAISVSFPFAAQFAAYAVPAKELPFDKFDYIYGDTTNKIKPHKSFYTEVKRQEYLLKKEHWHSMGFFLSVRELVEHECIAKEEQQRDELPFLSLDKKIDSFDGLSNLPQLRYVRSLGGRAETITEADTRGLTRLENLWIGRHWLHSIPGIASLTTLTELDLGNNQLTNAALCLSALQSLTSLDLGSNRLTSLAPLTTLTRLQKLNVNGNQLTTLPEDELRSHQQLTSLEAGSNWNEDQKQALTRIDGVYLLTNLRKLQLDRNQLADIKPEIMRLANLTNLLLDDNKITHLGPLALLSSLTDLHVRHNKITNVSPEEIEQLQKIPSLTSLGLGCNHIPKEIKTCIKDALKHVKWVTFEPYMRCEEFEDED